MNQLWYFLHILGYCVWIGGALAAMTVSIAARREPVEQLGVVVRLQAGIYRSLIGPGALASTVSGFVLTLQMYNRATAVGLSPWLMAMQGLGLAAAVMVFIGALPTSAKLARLEPTGPSAPAFHGLRRRMVIWGMSSGMIALAALLTGALYRYG